MDTQIRRDARFCVSTLMWAKKREKHGAAIIAIEVVLYRRYKTTVVFKMKTLKKPLTAVLFVVTCLGFILPSIVSATPPPKSKCKGDACESLEVEYQMSNGIIIGVSVENHGDRKARFRVDVENPYGSVQELKGDVWPNKTKRFKLSTANQNIGGDLKRAAFL